MTALKDWHRKEFYIKHWIKIILFISITLACTCYSLDSLNIIEFDKVNALLIDDLLINRESILISVAAIFIGVYFSIFTILLSLKNNSKIVAMGIKTFRELLEFLQHAFVGAFVYIIYAIFYPLISILNEISLVKFTNELLLTLLIIYMLLTALRVGVAFIFIFHSDLNTFFSSIEKEQIEKEESQAILYQMRSFLEAHELKEFQKKALQLNEVNKNKNARSIKKDS